MTTAFLLHHVAPLQILESTLEQMSWGGATVFIHQKVLA
jgi:hypothetical protein